MKAIERTLLVLLCLPAVAFAAGKGSFVIVSYEGSQDKSVPCIVIGTPESSLPTNLLESVGCGRGIIGSSSAQKEFTTVAADLISRANEVHLNGTNQVRLPRITFRIQLAGDVLRETNLDLSKGIQAVRNLVAYAPELNEEVENRFIARVPKFAASK